MKRRPPPARPRGAPSPHYRTLDGNYVVVAARPEPPPTSPKPPTDPGPDFTTGEAILNRFLESQSEQAPFDWNETAVGDLRQYWCPHCDMPTSTVVRHFHCEHCGEWFSVADIWDQVEWLIDDENPQVLVPYQVSEFLSRAFHDILYGVDPRDALELKPGKKRTGLMDYYVQRHAAETVHERLLQTGGKGKTAICNEVAGLFADRRPSGELDGRTVGYWYQKFYEK